MLGTIRRLFAIMIAAPLFVGLTWFFGIYLHPQGSTGAGFAAVLILLSAIASIIVYRWLASPGPKANFRNKGVDGYDRDFGLGLTGYSEHKGGRRRRDDDPDPDSVGGRRNSGDDLDGEEGLA